VKEVLDGRAFFFQGEVKESRFVDGRFRKLDLQLFAPLSSSQLSNLLAFYLC